MKKLIVVFKIILALAVIASLSLNIVLFKMTGKMKKDIYDIKWDVSTIDSNVNDIENTMSDLAEQVDDIADDVSDIWYNIY